jgi:hypothetical protein
MNYIYKQHLCDYFFCPYLYAKNILSNKYGQKLSGDYKKFKDFMNETASYEMKNNTKLNLAEYRAGYTNRFFSNKSDIFNKDTTGLVAKLNNIFSVFSDNVFIGFNVPVEIVIPSTQNIFKDTISYLLTNVENSKVTVVEIDDLSGDNFNFYRRALKDWPQYYTTYSYLAFKFNCPVEVIILDPIENTKIEAVFLQDRYKDDLKELGDVIMPIDKNILYKNFYACGSCELIGECK